MKKHTRQKLEKIVKMLNNLKTSKKVRWDFSEIGETLSYTDNIIDNWEFYEPNPIKLYPAAYRYHGARAWSISSSLFSSKEWVEKLFPPSDGYQIIWPVTEFPVVVSKEEE